ncbi:squalene cyclase [Propioniciclava sp.]|uniref:squalene cyclase n=1 Tax=Propioniciclava sp. TaxID=2038686 RepID=UPI00261BE1AA|nr:squalene cyclase [Propioniciclava sp.]
MDVLDWLLASDPALAWQVERDLAGADETTWRATRARVATEGYGAGLLALQDADGQWAGGAYFPKTIVHPVEWGDREAQPWMATAWALKDLREWGVDAAVLGDTAERIAANARWEYDDLPYWGGEVDACINASTLATGQWLGADVSGLRAWFDEHRLSDGGWNCDWVEGATVSSFHSTLNALVGLREFSELGGGDTRESRRRGEEYLLARRLRLRASTGEPVADWVDRLEYPFRWRYSTLRALDHFRAASLLDGTPPDPRLADAMAVLRAQRSPDGTWAQGRRDPGAVWFLTDADVGEPSKWLTFFALRILQWWDADATVGRAGDARGVAGSGQGK